MDAAALEPAPDLGPHQSPPRPPKAVREMILTNRTGQSSARRPHLCSLVVAIVAALASALFVSGARSASDASALIAFTRSDGGVYVMRADGTGVRQLRPESAAGGASALTWSPDGRKLAFTTSLNPADPARGIWVMKADGGSDPVRIVKGRIGPLSWSADGRRIAYAWYNDIWAVNADGSNRQRLTNMPSSTKTWVDWSPSGSRIAFSTFDIPPGVYAMDTSGRNVHRLARQATLPDWSPDGRRIAFTSLNDPDSTEISVMAASGRSQVRLTHTKQRESNPTWSPDGRKIAFLRADTVSTGAHEIYAMNADGTGVTRLTHTFIGEVTSLAWQPVATS